MAGELLQKAGHWNPWGVATGSVALALLVLAARFRRLPGALLVIAGGVLASRGLDLPGHGVPLVGAITLHLSTPSLPVLNYASWLNLGELAGAMVLVLYAESYSSIRGFSLKHGKPFEPNRELLALGVANVAAGLLHGLPVGAGYSATAANEAAGATSRASGWVAAALVLLIVLLMLPLLALTPEPVLAAIVIHAVSHTLNPEVFRPYFVWRRDRSLVIIAALAVLLFGVLPGLLAGIGVSLAMMLRRMAETRVSVLGQLGDGHDYVTLKHYPQARQRPGLLIARPETAMFFANADRIVGQLRQLLRADPAARRVILSLEESPDLDSTSIEAIRDLAQVLRSEGRQLLLARLKDRAHYALLRATIPGLPDSAMGFPSVDDAVQAAAAMAAPNLQNAD